jgi:hypothetical protein
VAVFEVDGGDLADLDAGDVDRLALTRGDRLGGVNSAEIWSNSSPTKGSQAGSEAFCSVKIPSIITIPTKARTRIAIVSVR